MYKLILIVLALFPSHAKKTFDHEIFLISSGFSASLGHHAVKIVGAEVYVDTSFFMTNNSDYTATEEYIKKHSVFVADLQLKTSSRKIYSILANTDIKVFKQKETLLKKTDCVYQVQEMTIHKNNKTLQYKFHLTEMCCPESEREFVQELQLLFPFGYYFGVNCQKFYSSDL